MQRIAGIDEAGRGPWAGPVVAACVVLGEHTDRTLLRDSKQLTEAKRTHAYTHIIETCEVHTGLATVEEINHYSIRYSTFLAMQRAVCGFQIPPDHLLVDGNDAFTFSVPHTSIIRGDSTEAAISAASIIAKVFRDQLMEIYAQLYPEYSFSTHKGYGTKLHQEALQEFGICPLHRIHYKPIKEYLASVSREDPLLRGGRSVK